MIHDVAIVGAGIAGASLAAALDPRLSVILFEQEDHPGYHATGRSAAFWDECYGGPAVVPLTLASGPFLKAPPSEYGVKTLLSDRGSVYIGRAEDMEQAAEFFRTFEIAGASVEQIGRDRLEALVPGIRSDWTHGIFTPSCADIDVAMFHAASLAVAKRRGAQLMVRAEVRTVFRQGDVWQIDTPAGQVRARKLVNAAGAWADELGVIAGAKRLGLQPYRRTIAQVRVDPPAPADLPLVIAIDGSFYFKPEPGGRLWLSPHDETPSAACDAAPDEFDVASAIDRLEAAVDLNVLAVERRWAGLRTFAPDRLPVLGWDSDVPGLFWCAGQGGYGIQTAPAIAALGAALIEGRAPSADVDAIDPAQFTPGRFAPAAL